MKMCKVKYYACNLLYFAYYVCKAFITALHAMQTRSSDEKAVRLSVRPSNA